MFRYAWVAVLLFGALLVAPRVSSASFHLMRIVEVFPGTTADTNAQYIMLQMYSGQQNFVGGHSVQVLDASGAPVGTFTFPSSVANGSNQATILIGTADIVSLFGVQPDLAMSPVLPLRGGAVCYDVIDCVAWGNFSGTGLPSPPGTPFNAGDGLLFDTAMRRNLGSDGKLGVTDDSNDSASDFLFAAPAPRSNAGQTVATPTASPTPSPTPTETPTLPRQCAGDCNSDLVITNVELLTLIDIALGDAAAGACPALATKPDGQPSVAEIVRAVNDATDTCAPVVVVPSGY